MHYIGSCQIIITMATQTLVRHLKINEKMLIYEVLSINLLARYENNDQLNKVLHTHFVIIAHHNFEPWRWMP